MSRRGTCGYRGKARLISDLFCDGLGACIKTCPEGAIRVIEREEEPYDEHVVMKNIVKQGSAVITAHIEHQRSHGKEKLYHQAVEFLQARQIPVPNMHSCYDKHDHGNHSFAGCPGAAARSIHQVSSRSSYQTGTPKESELRQWPVQLRLLHPQASYFNNADILVAADCVPFAYAGFHEDFLKRKILIIFCPKLDADIEEYIEKMAAIFGSHPIHSVTIVHMEVPCCSGISYVVNQAMKQSKSAIPVKEVTISIDGNVK